MQANLILDRPYRRPGPASYLSLCQQYGGCTCCNASHDATVQRQLYSIISDPAFDQQCESYLSATACRYALFDITPARDSHLMALQLAWPMKFIWQLACWP